MRTEASTFFRSLQTEICRELEREDGRSTFSADQWERPEGAGGHGGGGISRILKRGAVFEQAGVNFSEVHGTLPAEMSERLVGAHSETVGIS